MTNLPQDPTLLQACVATEPMTVEEAMELRRETILDALEDGTATNFDELFAELVDIDLYLQKDAGIEGQLIDAGLGSAGVF